MQSGHWRDSNSERFRGFLKHASNDLFDSPTIRHMRDQVDFSTVKNALSIGSGNGRYDFALMNHLPIQVDFIEPNAKMGLVENLDPLKETGQVGFIHQGTFETFNTESR